MLSGEPRGVPGQQLLYVYGVGITMKILERLVPSDALRSGDGSMQPRVTNMELFFDLVYVFTIIQLSHFLLAHQSVSGAFQSAILFAAVWWAWNLTAWAANWIDPDHRAGRTLMILLMACALVMAVGAPYAFGERALLFAGAYVAMSLIRGVYMSLAFRGRRMGANYLQLTAWSTFAAVFWIVGAVLPEYRLALWIMAVATEYAAPYAGFWLPGWGRTPMESWPLEGLHLLERNQLVFIIALGESVLLLGGTLVKGDWSDATWPAAAIGFLLIVSLWFIYFVHTSEQGEHAFVHRDVSDHTRLARAGLTYAHGVMVAGAIVMAVAIEEVLAHPIDVADQATIFFSTLGPALFLLGSVLFHRTMAAKVPAGYIVGLVALVVWAFVALAAGSSALVLGAGVLVILVSIAIYASAMAQETEAA